MIQNKAYKGRSGVYCIINSVNGLMYVGQTKCMFTRCRHYIYDFENKRTRQMNARLLGAMLEFGIDKFEMSALEFCDESLLIETERKWIEMLGTTDGKCGYNLRVDTDSGMLTHNSTSKKITANLKKQWDAGIRDGHSDKLKKNWEDNPHRKIENGAMFRERLTKYSYKVTKPDGVVIDCNYAQLCELGLKNIPASFHRKKTNDVMYKSYRVVRLIIKDRSW